jgi:cytochrome c biogenesis protein CcmG, thiol:disulfide interchange protein DsbE
VINRPELWAGRFIPLVVLFLAAAALTGCSGDTNLFTTLRERFPGAGDQTGRVAPEFAFDTFTGERYDLADLKGRPVVLNFWASWCIPCRAEMPYFENVYREHRDDGVIFLGLAVQDDPQSAREFLHTVGVTYPTGIDRANQVSTAYGLVGLPTTIFITPDATIARRWNGPVSEAELTALVTRIKSGSSQL